VFKIVFKPYLPEQFLPIFCQEFMQLYLLALFFACFSHLWLSIFVTTLHFLLSAAGGGMIWEGVEDCTPELSLN